jgi:hypothetical protein
MPVNIPGIISEIIFLSKYAPTAFARFIELILSAGLLN